MTEGEVVDLAKRIASSNGWPWIVPVQVKRKRRLLGLGVGYWTVLSNSDSIGCSIYLEIDDSTGAVVKCAFRKR